MVYLTIRESAAVLAFLLVGQLSTKVKYTIVMKKQNQGTQSVPSLSTSDFYYVAAIGAFCATFIVPVCIVVVVFCVYKAKKGGSK